jgi:site-specific DNA recombinase
MAPLGHDSKNRQITANDVEADCVRTIFQSYLKLGSLNLLMADLRKRGIVTKVRTLKSGQTIGGIPFTRGPLAYLLRNRFYIGKVAFKGETLEGEQPAIIDRNLFDAVQAKLDKQVNNHKASRTKSEALLSGRLYDDRGNRMTSSHVRKRGIKYRYYISSALLHGRAKQAGSLSRISAHQIESFIVKSVRAHLSLSSEIEDAIVIRTYVVRVEIQSDQLIIKLATANGADRKGKQSRNVIVVPWRKARAIRRREILLPDSVQPANARPIRAENRALLVASIARGRRWLDELIADPAATTDRIAKRESCTTRKVNMTISLAFLAPDLVKAAIDGRLPHGMGVARLADLSAEWSRQHQMLGVPVL